MTEMLIDPEEMRDMQYREENPGYEREIAYMPNHSSPELPDYVAPEDRDPELEEVMHEIYARDNRKRREHNEQTRINGLIGLLEEHGIEIPDDI